MCRMYQPVEEVFFTFSPFFCFLTRLVRLEINHHKNLADLLHGDEVSSKVCVLHHLPELVGLDGEGAANARARSEAVVLEDAQDGLVEWRNSLLHLRADRQQTIQVTDHTADTRYVTNTTHQRERVPRQPR